MIQLEPSLLQITIDEALAEEDCTGVTMVDSGETLVGQVIDEDKLDGNTLDENILVEPETLDEGSEILDEDPNATDEGLEVCDTLNDGPEITSDVVDEPEVILMDGAGVEDPKGVVSLVKLTGIELVESDALDRAIELLA